MKRKPFAVLASLFLVLAIAVSCNSEIGYPSVDCTIYLDGQEYDLIDNKTLTVKGNSGVELPVLPSSDSRVFVGWSTSKNADDVVELADGRYYPERNGKITLYAIWANTTVNIYFHSNYGDGDVSNDIYRSVQYTYMDNINIKNIDGTPTNKYEFAGWYTSRIPGEGDKLVFGETKVPTENTHYYAQWKKPVTITWSGKDGYSLTTETKAFENIVFPEVKPEDKEGEYRFANTWIDEKTGEEINDSVAITVYEDHTYNAKYGEKVDIIYMYNGEEYTSKNQTYNYMYFPYNLPIPTDEEIPNFGAWFMLSDDKEIKVDSNMVVESNDIKLYARTGKKVEIELKGTPTSDNLSKGNVVIVNGFDSGIRIDYPNVQDYESKSVLYLDETLDTPIIWKDGSFAKNVDGFTDENGMWISDNVPEVLYADWTEPKQVGGAIMLKLDENIDYVFFDENFNELEEHIELNIPTYTNKDNGQEAVPYYYVINGTVPTGDDIEDFGYVVVYDKNGESKTDKFINGKASQKVNYFGSPDISKFDEIVSTLRNSKDRTGIEMTNLLIKYDTIHSNNTIAYWTDKARKDSGFDDWFVPSYKDFVFMANYITNPKLLSFLGIVPLALNDFVLWTSSCKSTTNAYGIIGRASTLVDFADWVFSPNHAGEWAIFIMRLI